MYSAQRWNCHYWRCCGIFSHRKEGQSLLVLILASDLLRYSKKVLDTQGGEEPLSCSANLLYPAAIAKVPAIGH